MAEKLDRPVDVVDQANPFKDLLICSDSRDVDVICRFRSSFCRPGRASSIFVARQSIKDRGGLELASDSLPGDIDFAGPGDVGSSEFDTALADRSLALITSQRVVLPAPLGPMITFSA
ncbi:MAG: hypothetical protein Ct9H300mP1_01330 [Planctomycetaceae bacterium]|nr:MAG: hypothetical protein Ct9H300mP1_01330 [Planctomycetaceae bacterium]